MDMRHVRHHPRPPWPTNGSNTRANVYVMKGARGKGVGADVLPPYTRSRAAQSVPGILILHPSPSISESQPPFDKDPGQTKRSDLPIERLLTTARSILWWDGWVLGHQLTKNQFKNDTTINRARQ